MIPATPGPWQVDTLDGTTVYSDHLHLGVAACAPDPMCREHYRGGLVGGNYFAPPDSLGERQANARLISRAPAMRDLLLALELHMRVAGNKRQAEHAAEGRELRVSVQEMLEYLGILPS
jgi:hypothetical protein